MKIKLSGSHGMLGKALSDAIGLRGWESEPLDRSRFVLCQTEKMVPLLDHCDLFIHAAANTNVEYCETHPEECYRDNTRLTEVLVEAAAREGVRMVFISSTGVYGDHKKEPYSEEDETHPTTHHHRSKLLAEKVVLAVPGNLVIRSGWLFGGETANPKNFVARRLEEALACEGVMRSNSLQRGCPTYSADLAARILDLVERSEAGVFNCVNEGNASRYEYVAGIVELACLKVRVEPVNADAFQRKAKVSQNEMASNQRMLKNGLPQMRPWSEAMGDYLRHPDMVDFIQRCARL